MTDIIVILFLIVLNGLFSMSEVALINARKTSLAADAKGGSRSAARALKLVEDPGRFLSTVQIGITLVGILTGLFSGARFADVFSAFIQKFGLAAGSAGAVSRIVIVSVVTYLSIVLGELFPKKLGLSASEKIAKVMSGPMWALSVFCTPLVWLLKKSTDAVSSIAGVSEADSKVTEDEIRSMVAEGAEDGEVQEVEQDIVDRVFSLGDRTVESIMTSRNDVVWFEKDMGADEISAIVNENLYEMYPVGDGGLDDIVGVVFLKDLFFGLRLPDFQLSPLIRPAQYFHDNMDVYKALEMMKKNQTGYGIVCDEFGVCQGVVTYKDILAGLVGSIDDSEDEPDIVEIGNGEWQVGGQCPFYEFLAFFEKEDLEDSDSDYVTVGGLVLEQLEHIPAEGEGIVWNDFMITVTRMDGARIDRLTVRHQPDHV